MNWTNITVALNQLEPWERNPKRIGKKQAGRLLAYWKQIGQFQTIAIGPKNGNGKYPVYDGHQRLSVLLDAHGGSFEVAARMSDQPLTEAEREELVIQAHAGTTGSWDWDALAGWDVEALQEWGLDGDTLYQWREDAGALGLMLETMPNFEPVGEDEQPRLDQKNPVICPHCGMNIHDEP